MCPSRRIRAAALCAVCAIPLGGCVPQLIPEPAPPPATYDFGPPPEERPAPLPARFFLEDVTAASWLETTAIYYRRTDEQPNALRSYAQNEWIATPSELFAERLAHRLALAAPEAAARALPLTVEILRFEHVYTAAAEAHVVARVRAAFEDADGRVRRREFAERRSVAAAVGGATRGLPQAAGAVIDDVLGWLREETADRP